MKIQPPTKSFFIPQPPDEREIFWAMQRYPDNVKVYHPHGSIDATSVFWHNRLWPNILFFAVYVDPKAMDQQFLFHRVLDDLTKLAGKFSDKHLATSDYAPQHAFNRWLNHQKFTLTQRNACVTINPNELNIPYQKTTSEPRVLTIDEVLNRPALLDQFLTMSLRAYQADHPSLIAPTVSTTDWQTLITAGLVTDVPSLLLDSTRGLIAFSLLLTSRQTAGKIWFVHGISDEAAQQLTANQLTMLTECHQPLSICLPPATLKLLGLTEQMAAAKVTSYETFLR